jgi:hypothetical protein
MECPEDLLDALAEVLATGVLRVRAAGYRNDGARCTVEADHVHNLPMLLRHCNIEGVRFYWHTERRAFIDQSRGIDIAVFQAAWNTIASYAQ